MEEVEAKVKVIEKGRQELNDRRWRKKLADTEKRGRVRSPVPSNK